jgi:hypothetical protein
MRPMLRTAFALGVALALFAGPSLAADPRLDATGDHGGIGPDITAVTVDIAGSDLVIAVQLADDPPLTWSEADAYTDTIMLIASTDPEAPPDETLQGQRSTMNGFTIGVHAANIDSPPPFAPIVDGRSGEIEFGVAAVAVEGRTVTLSVPLAAIGDPASLHLFVFAGREGPQVGMDTYPDETWATYDVDALGAGGTTSIAAPVVVAVTLVAFAVLAILVGRAARRPITGPGPAAVR